MAAIQWSFAKILNSLGLSRLSKAFEAIRRRTNDKGLRILVTGKSGQGKSSLLNGLLGAKVAKEGSRAVRCTTDVETYTKTLSGITTTVFDSPGLQDGTDSEEEYLQEMRKQCQELSLVLYCTKMTDTRLTDDDKSAMIKLTKAFGESFWDYAVFVLTFANQENVERRDDRDQDNHRMEDLSTELKRQRFQGRVKLWQHELHEFLIKEVGVGAAIAINIPVVPTGDHKKTRTIRNPFRLPDRDNWFGAFWEVCCLRIKETSLFLEINDERMVEAANDIPHQALQSPKENQPSVLNCSFSDVNSASSNDDCTQQEAQQKYDRPRSVEKTSLICQSIPVSYTFVRSVTRKYVREGYIEDIAIVNEAFSEDMRLSTKDTIPLQSDVVRQLAPIAFQWNEIGMYLGVDHGTLMSLRHAQLSNELRLGDTIQSWLDTSTVTPSWKTLLNVVEKDLKNVKLSRAVQHFLATS